MERSEQIPYLLPHLSEEGRNPSPSNVSQSLTVSGRFRPRVSGSRRDRIPANREQTPNAHSGIHGYRVL